MVALQPTAVHSPRLPSGPVRSGLLPAGHIASTSSCLPATAMATSAPSLLQIVRNGAGIRHRQLAPLADRRSQITTRCSRHSLLLSPSRRTSHRFGPSWTAPKISARTHSACAYHGGSRKKKAYIALGSNLGDRVAEIEKACNEMDRRGIRVKRTSSLWETEPMYVLDQDHFLNGACEVSHFANELCSAQAVKPSVLICFPVPRWKLIWNRSPCWMSFNL